MPRSYLVTSELVDMTGIDTKEIERLCSEGKIQFYPMGKDVTYFPLSVLNQLKGLGYEGVPNVVPYGRTGYNAVDYEPLWANDGEDEIYLEPGQKIPKRYKPGRLPIELRKACMRRKLGLKENSEVLEKVSS